MTDRWRRIEEIFHAALARPSEERATFVAAACAGDETMRAEIVSLLGNADAAERFLESSPGARPSLVGQQVGAYRIEALIGEGGMGQVYRARDSRLGRAVALKLLPERWVAREAHVQRFVREARAASALNHPNIVTIHEIGDADGVHFIAQELIEGETLRARISRGPLPLGQALDLATQVTTAIAAAHAAGVIHRDIKPENVMVRADGLVKVLDFGLAKLAEPGPGDPDDLRATGLDLRTGSGVIVGTVRYMSPEQARGMKVDARSDLFSLGVLLYEMLTGRAPFSGDTPSDVLSAVLKEDPPPPSRLIESLPLALDQLVRRLLEKDPDERPQTTEEVQRELQALRNDLTAAGVLAPVQRSRRVRQVALPLVAVLVLAAVVLFAYFGQSPALSQQDTILLTDFANTTGETVFDGGTLKQGLAIQLRQTPFLNLVPQEAMRTTLAMMARSPDEHVTREIGLEICRRHGVKAMVTGTIARLGQNYVLTLEAVDGQSGDVIAIEQVEAENQERVLQALGRAATGLRRALGESLSTLREYNAPIEQATTSSLEALKAYSGGLEQIYRENGRAALPFFIRATELDPQFVAAFDWGAWAYLMSGNPAGATPFAEQAYRFRERATERERLSAVVTYHHFATGDLDEENRQCDVWKRLFANDWVPYSSLALNYLWPMGRFEDAANEAREVIRINPNVSQGYRFLAPALMSLGRLDEALAASKQAEQRQLDNVFLRDTRYQIALLQGDAAGATLALDAVRRHEGENLAVLWQARATSAVGRWREARDLFAGAGRALERFQRGTVLGLCQVNSPEARQALALSRLDTGLRDVTPAVTPDGALCGDAEEAQKFADALAARHPRSTIVRKVSLPALHAAIALRRDQPERAIELLRAAYPTSSGARFLPAYLRGQAYLRLRQFENAAAEFEAILAHRAWEATSPLYPLAYLGVARARALNGEVAASQKAYASFFAAWKDADSDLPVLVSAREDYGRLTGTLK